MSNELYDPLVYLAVAFAVLALVYTNFRMLIWRPKTAQGFSKIQLAQATIGAQLFVIGWFVPGVDVFEPTVWNLIPAFGGMFATIPFMVSNPVCDETTS